MTVSQKEDDWILSPDKEPDQSSAPKSAIIQRQKPPSHVQASVSDIKDYVKARSKKKLTKVNVVSPMSEVFLSTKNKDRWDKLRQHVQNLDLNRQ